MAKNCVSSCCFGKTFELAVRGFVVLQMNLELEANIFVQLLLTTEFNSWQRFLISV